MKLFSLAIFIFTLGLIVDSGSAEVSSLNSPLWKEIPDTKLNASSQYSDPANVNLNSVIRKGDIITYDLANSDAGYARMETNCKNRQSRSIRQGFFDSSSRVNFISKKDSWSLPEDSYKKSITLFICKHFR
jgi:hypothetical protein